LIGQSVREHLVVVAHVARRHHSNHQRSARYPSGTACL
jgi:hypothetical protein